jgi:hypothetical protein
MKMGENGNWPPAVFIIGSWLGSLLPLTVRDARGLAFVIGAAFWYLNKTKEPVRT